jgi:acetyl-CoA carboxylase carboxyl transferase subunit alpha
LWKDRRHAPEAAEALKLTAQDLMGLSVVDEIVPEPEGGAHRDPDMAAANLGTALRQNLERLSALSIDELMRNRYDKFRKLGKYSEETAAPSSDTAVEAK